MEIIRTVINTDLNDIKKFRDHIIEILNDRSYDDEIIFKLRLILDELTANSYKHGNLREFSKLIEISILLADGLSFIKIKDEGLGIYPSDNIDRFAENGRGIRLVESLADKTIILNNTIACLIYI